MKKFAIAALAVCAWIAAPSSDARAQQLGGAHEFVWPQEFSGAVSCRRLINSRDAYLARPRPRFNCIRGVDCPEDLAAAPAAEPHYFAIYYEWVDTRRTPIDVTMNAEAFMVVRGSVERLLGDMDRVARSTRKRIHVEGHTDTSENAEYSLEISQVLGQCVSTAVAVGLHLNGYTGAYDFDTTIVAKGESEPNVPTRDGIREPLNRRALVTISY